jgi:hypothetical protein
MIGRLKQQTASDGDGDSAALAVRLLNVMSEMSPALGFDPVVRLTGLDVPLPEDIDENLLAVLREALTTSPDTRTQAAPRWKWPRPSTG